VSAIFIPRSDCQIAGLGDIYERHGMPAKGRFVEVGAYDGQTISNTIFLAEMGWVGLFIEPHPEYAEACRRNHAKRIADFTIVVDETAVSNFEGDADLYVIRMCSSLVFDKTAVEEGGSINDKITVPVTTLDAVLRRNDWTPEFELLVIDVEQSELDVLEGFSVAHWQPKMVIIETHEKQGVPHRSWKAKPIGEYFDRYGYQKIHADAVNSIFVKA
jgi:FkbM family methyltransferase